LRCGASLLAERTTTRSSRSPIAVGGSFSSQDAALLERLKAWRLAEARTQSVPAFVILHDKTLAEIARQRPRTLMALGGVSGIGAKKLERYGPALVDAGWRSLASTSPYGEVAILPLPTLLPRRCCSVGCCP
jgi:superfamily II DNA helicase RecQ